jgi:hypothetical protein
MDRAFNELKAHAIEIDAKVDARHKVYVVHDPITEGDLGDAAEAYLRNNTLEKVITHFSDKRYYDPTIFSPAGKYVFIEIKVPKKEPSLNYSGIDDEEADHIRRVMSSIGNVVSKEQDADRQARIEEHIGFASFNFYALRKAYEEDPKRKYRYYFIAGVNTLPGFAYAMCDRDINYLSDDLKNKVAKAEWLTGIWFSPDPLAILDAANTLNTLNKDRERKLVFHIATYFQDKDDYRNSLEKGVGRGEEGDIERFKNVEGLILDIQDKEESKGD